MFRFICSGTLFLFFWATQAASTQVNHCQPVSITADDIVLSAKKPAFFLIHNKTASDVWLSHPAVAREGDMSIRVAPKKWSALILKQSDFTVHCVESRPGHEQQLPCASLVTVCQAAKVVIPAAKQSTRFLTKNVHSTLALWRPPVNKG